MLYEITDDTNKSSLNKFIEGGAPKLITQRMNIKDAAINLYAIKPLLTNNLRLEDRSYNVFTYLKRPEEQIPWPISIKILPFNPYRIIVNTPANASPMWATEE